MKRPGLRSENTGSRRIAAGTRMKTRFLTARSHREFAGLEIIQKTRENLGSLAGGRVKVLLKHPSAIVLGREREKKMGHARRGEEKKVKTRGQRSGALGE